MRYRWTLVAACLVGLATVRGSVSPGQAPAQKALSTWEYKTLVLAGAQDDRLNILGDQGWELVGVTSQGSNLYYAFKRAKQE